MSQEDRVSRLGSQQCATHAAVEELYAAVCDIAAVVMCSLEQQPTREVLARATMTLAFKHLDHAKGYLEQVILAGE